MEEKKGGGDTYLLFISCKKDLKNFWEYQTFSINSEDYTDLIWNRGVIPDHLFSKQNCKYAQKRVSKGLQEWENNFHDRK